MQSIHSISWQLTNIIPKKLYTKNKDLTFQTLKNDLLERQLSDSFEKIASKWEMSQIWLSDLYNWPLGCFNKIHSLIVHWYLPKEASYQKRKKDIQPFLSIQPFKWKVDGWRTDDGRTTENSPLEKLRCLLADEAKNWDSLCKHSAFQLFKLLLIHRVTMLNAFREDACI